MTPKTETRRASRYRLMIEAGRDNAYIARRMGVKEATVQRMRWQLQARPNGNPVVDHEARRGEYKNLFEQGLDDAEVAKRMGVHIKTAARNRLRILGKGPSFEERHGLDLEHIANQYNLNGKIKPLADQYGVPRDTIYTALKHARRKGLVTREPKIIKPYSEEELERARRMLVDERMSYAMTAAELGRSAVDALARHFPGMGWTPTETQQYRWMREKLDSL